MDVASTARWFVAGTYGAIALVAAVDPARVPALFGGTAETAASRTEVRTVYAGIPAAFALAAARTPIAERRLAPWPTGAFAVLEVALAVGSRLARVRAG